MANRTSKNVGGEWPKYGTISSQSGSIHANKDSIHVTDDLRYEDDEEDYDQDDNGYTRFVRLRSDSGNFFTEGLSQEQLKLVVNLVINLSEWYAFAIFGYFSDVMGGVFFPPSQTIQSALVESFATFGSAFVTRPIGGLCLGYLGDKYGRKLSLEVSVLLMAIATLSMSCLPTYSQVGAVSYVLLAVLRLVQGLSVGGQLMGSLVYAVESKPTKHWGYHGSMIMAAANFGNVMSGVTVYCLRVEMSEEALERIGWRIPNVVVGVVLSLCGLCLKYLLEEDSMHGIELNKDALHHSNPLKLACAPTNRRSLLAACMVPMLWSTGFWLTFVWMATYMFKLIPTPMSAPAAFGVNSVALFLGVCVFYPIAGILSDIYGRRTIMTIGGVCYGALAPMLLIVIGRGKAIEALAAQTLLGMFLSLWGGPMMAWLVESFDPQTRLTSAAVGYNLGAMVAGVAPVAATLLVDQLGPWTPGVLLSFLAAIGLTGLWVVAPKPNPNQTVT